MALGMLQDYLKAFEKVASGSRIAKPLLTNSKIYIGRTQGLVTITGYSKKEVLK